METSFLWNVLPSVPHVLMSLIVFQGEEVLKPLYIFQTIISLLEVWKPNSLCLFTLAFSVKHKRYIYIEIFSSVENRFVYYIVLLFLSVSYGLYLWPFISTPPMNGLCAYIPIGLFRSFPLYETATKASLWCIKMNDMSFLCVQLIVLTFWLCTEVCSPSFSFASFTTETYFVLHFSVPTDWSI